MNKNTPCISLKELFDAYAQNGVCELYYGDSIAFDGESYTLYNLHGELACLDGEECNVEEITKDQVLISNHNGEYAVCFVLSTEEFKIATFNKVEV